MHGAASTFRPITASSDSHEVGSSYPSPGRDHILARRAATVTAVVACFAAGTAHVADARAADTPADPQKGKPISREVVVTGAPLGAGDGGDCAKAESRENSIPIGLGPPRCGRRNLSSPARSAIDPSSRRHCRISSLRITMSCRCRQSRPLRARLRSSATPLSTHAASGLLG